MPGFASPSLCDAVSGNRVMNCGFETGDFTNWTPTGTVGPDFEVTTNLPNSSGDDARLGDVTFDYLDQSFATTANNIYNVSFYINTIASGGVSSSGQFVANWNGTNFLTIPGPNTGSLNSQGYEYYSFKIKATSNSTDLQFGAFTADSYYHLDDVVVTAAGDPVPEPASTSFAVAGLLAVLLIGGRYAKILIGGA